MRVSLWYSVRSFASSEDKERTRERERARHKPCFITCASHRAFIHIDECKRGYDIDREAALQASMAEQTPKPMRKVNRNIFKKVGQRLGEFEQSLGLSSPNLAHGSVQSLSALSDGYGEEQPSHEETVSLRSMPSNETESPREVRHRKNASGHSTNSHGEFSNASWENEGEIESCFLLIIGLC